MKGHFWSASMGWCLFALLSLLLLSCSGSHGADAGADGGGGACMPACDTARDCCDGECTNLANDPRNCGVCGTACSLGTYCTAGQCTPTPCDATCGGSETCCGSECCAAGQICCDPQGPIDMGPRCLAPDERGTCPTGCAPLCICASPDTPIATPEGDRPIASLRRGDLVYSVDRDAVVIVPVAATGRTPVSHHHVVRVRLENGSVLEISAGHPTADGRTFGELAAGDPLGDVRITGVTVIPYDYPYTYDILPHSDTGTYFAGGALIGSTLGGHAK